MRRNARRFGLIPMLLAAFAGCATTRDHAGPLVPSRFQTRTGPFVVFTNEPIAPDAPVASQLRNLQDEFQQGLGVDIRKVEPPIEVYLLTDRKSFEHFLTFYYPELPQRRAFFLSQGERRVIYTFVSDKVEVDVRHEATHALASVAFGELPLWLDEGLAEYFECPGEFGNNPENLRRLASEPLENWKPDLARLERLKAVREMTPTDYRESWAWTHLLLSGAPRDREVVRAYLSKDPSTRGSLAQTLGVDDGMGNRLANHVRRLSEEPPRETVAREQSSTVRLQDSVDDAVVPVGRAKPKKNPIGKLREFLFGF